MPQPKRDHRTPRLHEQQLFTCLPDVVHLEKMTIHPDVGHVHMIARQPVINQQQ